MKSIALLVAAGGIAALALALAIASPASADSQVVRGELGGSRALERNPHLDIRRASHGHATGGRLKHKVTMRGRIRPQQKNSRPFILISTRGGPRSRPQFVVVGPRVLRVRRNGELGRKAGANRFNEQRRAWVYKFHPRTIGNPRRYGWAAATIKGGAEDRVPKHRYRYHRLR